MELVSNETKIGRKYMIRRRKKGEEEYVCVDASSKSAIRSEVCVCVRVYVLYSHLFCMLGLWTYQTGSHRRKVNHDFSSIFLLRCLPNFFWREGSSRSFPSSTVKTN